jgi:alpha-galactosidase
MGLAPVADAAHKEGAKFMLWFEPERVMKNSDWAMQHPAWMLNAYDAHDAYLFNLGDAEARQWFCGAVGKLIADNKVDYYRQDFNMEIDVFWKNNDQVNREGITEIRYIEGLYAFWDYLLKRFPGLIIDNCASGGRRIDLETTSRSAPMWRTDYNNDDAIGRQAHTYGLELYLPLHGTGLNKTDKYNFRSTLGTSIVYNWKLTEPGSSIAEMQQCEAEFNKVRPFFTEDYYPLTATEETTADNAWMAYELHRPSDDSGFIVAFRRPSAEAENCTVKLLGLRPEKQYSIVNEDTGETIRRSGAELAKGLVLTLKTRKSSLLLRFGAN